MKGPHAFRTISEASEEVGVPQHVLRFWETRFPFIQPMKRAGGRRFYRPQDIVVLHAVRRRLHEDGLTIKGVQKLHKEGGLRRLTGEDLAGDVTPAAPAAQSADRASTNSRGAALRAILDDLEAAKARLDAVLAR